MTTRTLCWNCKHADVCKFLERIKEAFKEFPFKEDPKRNDSEYLISLDFSDIEPAIASACEKFLIRTEGSIREHSLGE